MDIGPSGRSLAIGIDFAPRRIARCLCFYIPHRLRPIGERAFAPKELDTNLDKYTKHGPTLALGDCNARLHGRLSAEEHVLGPHLYGLGYDEALTSGEGHWETKGDTNRELIIDMRHTLGLKAMNTRFQHKGACAASVANPGWRHTRAKDQRGVPTHTHTYTYAWHKTGGRA